MKVPGQRKWEATEPKKGALIPLRGRVWFDDRLLAVAEKRKVEFFLYST